MTRLTMLIDLQRCIGCWSCNVACKQENNVPPQVYRNQLFTIGPFGEYPDVQGYFLTRPCMHCEDAACVKACPTGASYQNGSGQVLIDHDKCIVCGYCTWACPYGARSINPVTNQIEACTQCVHLTSQGQEPACVHHCMGKARFFGDLDDPNSDIAKHLAANQERAFKLLESKGTKPRVIYLAPKMGALVPKPQE
jgi:Fe-S-cluster-containing dehydrogenase component